GFRRSTRLAPLEDVRSTRNYCSQINSTVNPSPLDFLEIIVYSYGMPRPPKDARLRMSTDLRIPVTAEQKRLISQAVATDPDGLAAWARRILLAAAQESVGRQAESKPTPDGLPPSGHR